MRLWRRTSETVRKRRGARISTRRRSVAVTLMVSLSLLLGTIAGPAAPPGFAVEPSPLCATHATSFATEGDQGTPVTVRLGCAKEAGVSARSR